MTAGVQPVDEFNDYFKSPRFAKVIYRVMWLSSSGEDSPGAWPAGTRDEIVRGFFHRINRILSRKNQIFDIDTIFYSPYYVKKSLKNRIF